MSATGPDGEAQPTANAAHQAGHRAARNTLSRAAGEIVGKLASLVLFTVLGRHVGQAGLGAFVFAFAFVQLATVPVDQGFDRWMLRRIAGDPKSANSVVGNVLVLKVLAALPVGALALGALQLIGPTHQERATVYALAGGLFIDSLSRTMFAAFSAIEHSEMLAAALVLQRVSAAALGLIALGAGYGVVTVAGAYTAGALAGFVLAWVLLHRQIGRLTSSLDRATALSLMRASLPFAVQDVFSAIIFRIDAVLLSIMAAAAAVGRYGAAYRLFESTLFLSVSVLGAFSAMYTYLGPQTAPTVASVFQRSIKVVLAPLVPIAVAFGLLAAPITRLIFGSRIEAAAAPLRILAPSIVLLGVITLSASLYVSRRDPRGLVSVTAWMALVNVVLNLALIPIWHDKGSAAAMTATEALYCVIALRMAVKVVDGVDWPAMLASPLVAGAVAALPMLALRHDLLPAVAAGGAAYLVTFVAVERAVAPADLRFATAMLRRFLRLRTAA